MKPYQIIKAFKVVMMLLLLTLLCCTFGSCKAKKKAVDRERKEIKREQVVQVNELQQNDIKTETEINSGSTIKKYSSDQIITAKKNTPSSDPIIFEDENGKQTKVYGADEVTIEEKKQSETRQDTTAVKNKASDNSTKTTEGSYKGTEDIDESSRKTNTWIFTTSTWLYILAGFLGLAALVLFWFFGRPKKRKKPSQ